MADFFGVPLKREENTKKDRRLGRNLRWAPVWNYFFGFLAGELTIFLLHILVASLPVEAISPPANNIADWRSLVVIAIGSVAILCFFIIRALVSRPLGKLIEKCFVRWDAVVARGGRISKWSVLQFQNRINFLPWFANGNRFLQVCPRAVGKFLQLIEVVR